MKESVVHKPWGYEYLAYQNKEVGLWILNINPNQSTSMHCHTKKTTGLIVLDGKIQISFIGDHMNLEKLEKRMIRRGLFHSSKCISKEPTILLEIETPNDKEDLVRLSDDYGRQLKPYEAAQDKVNETCIYFSDPTTEIPNEYSFANCNISIEKISTTKEFLSRGHDQDLLVFLKGGIKTPTNQNVVIPGDVGYFSIVKTVAEKIPYLEENTIIMRITNKL